MRNPPYHPLIDKLLNIQDCVIYPTSYVPNKEKEYDVPYPIYIPYIGPYNVLSGVICQGRVVTCFDLYKNERNSCKPYSPRFSVFFEPYQLLIPGQTTEKPFIEPTDKLVIEPTFQNVFFKTLENKFRTQFDKSLQLKSEIGKQESSV